MKKAKDSIAEINEEVGRLKGLEEMRVQEATTRVEVAKAELQPTLLEAQAYLEMLEAAEERYRPFIESIQERRLTETFANGTAMAIDDANAELSKMLHLHARQLRQAVDLIENLSSLDLDVNRLQEIRSIVARSDGAEKRIEDLKARIGYGLVRLNKQSPPENGTKIKVDPPGKEGLPRLHHEKPNLKVIT